MTEVIPSRTRTVMRRAPVQRRSAARVHSILDACAALLDEHDYDELSTSRIAERAGVPIGSLYQYFPDKRAVVQALTLRNLDAFSVDVERVFDGDGVPTRWPDAVDLVLDRYLRMLGDVPGFARIGFGDVVDTHLLDADADNDAVIAATLSRLFARSYGVGDTDELRFAFATVVSVAGAMVKQALRVGGERRTAALDTTREVLHVVLARHLDGSQPPPGPAAPIGATRG